MNRVIYLITIAFIMFGCVSQSEHDELKKENENLKNKIEELEANLSELNYHYERLQEEKRLAEIERNSKKYRTENEALSMLRDYYDFYNANYVYRNPRVRRVDNNTFRISLEICLARLFNTGFESWESTVKTLVINNDGTYTIR